MLRYPLSKKQWLALTLLLAITSIGVGNEFGSWADSQESLSFYPNALLAVGLLSLYFVPFYLLVRYGSQKLDCPSSVFNSSLFFGLFATGWLAVLGNNWLNHFWGQFLSKKTLTDWDPALTAPFAEELVKGAIACLILLLLNRWQKEVAFITGLGIGIGFQVSEDISYILQSALEKSSEAVPIAFSRLSGALSSHYLYTALLVSGIAYLVRKDSSQPKYKPILWVISPIMIHFIWNSPFENDWLTTVISTISLLIFYDLTVFVFMLYKNKKDNFSL